MGKTGGIDRIGYGKGDSPEFSLVEIFKAILPQLRIRNTTLTDAEGGRASRVVFEGTDSDGVVTELADIVASHATGGKNSNGGIVIRTNNGVALVETLKLFENGLILSNTTDPRYALQNISPSNDDGRRESEFIGLGQKADPIVGHMVGRMRFEHDGSGNDQKGRWILSLNKGNDDLLPTDVLGVGSADGFIIHNGVRSNRLVAELADEANYAIASSTRGFGSIVVEDNEEWASFSWNELGAVTLQSNSANVVNTDTDTKFCIFDTVPGGVVIKNRLGTTKDVLIKLEYYAP